MRVAGLAAPAWWDPDGVSADEDWHYRVPVTLPAASSVNSTALVNVDFSALLTQLGVSGGFDVNSVRVVRPGGALAGVQEFTDSVYSGATDAAGNARGEVRWIVQDGGAQTYYIYFDIAANGAKSANPQTPINGNFERGGTGQISPAGWTGTRTNSAYDAQVRPSETVSVTDSDGSGQTRSTNGTPNSGGFAYLLGARSNSEPASGESQVVLTRTVTVPATSPGNLTVRWKPEGWDSADNGTADYDFLRIEIVGSTTTEVVGPAAGNYATRPFAPNMGTSAASASTPGYGQYNGWDMRTGGAHTAGMTVAQGAEPWWTYNASLAAFAGQTVTIRFRTRHTTQYRSWFLIDDIEWSVVTGTLGTPQGFGAQVVAPAAASSLPPGTNLSIRARFDARPTAATAPVTANVYDNAGTLVASAIRLFDDGTHGDTTSRRRHLDQRRLGRGRPNLCHPARHRDEQRLDGARLRARPLDERPRRSEQRPDPSRRAAEPRDRGQFLERRRRTVQRRGRQSDDREDEQRRQRSRQRHVQSQGDPRRGHPLLPAGRQRQPRRRERGQRQRQPAREPDLRTRQHPLGHELRRRGDGRGRQCRSAPTKATRSARAGRGRCSTR